MVAFKSIVLAVLVTAVAASVAVAEPGTSSELTALSGQGSGRVVVSPTAKDRPIFDVEGTVDVQGVVPDAMYRVSRAVDRSDIGNADGVCPRLPSGSSSWRPVPSENGLLTTSAGGAGALHFEINPSPPTPFVSGVSFDVQWQVIRVNADGSLDPSQELRSECFTVTVK